MSEGICSPLPSSMRSIFGGRSAATDAVCSYGQLECGVGVGRGRVGLRYASAASVATVDGRDAAVDDMGTQVVYSVGDGKRLTSTWDVFTRTAD